PRRRAGPRRYGYRQACRIDQRCSSDRAACAYKKPPAYEIPPWYHRAGGFVNQSSGSPSGRGPGLPSASRAGRRMDSGMVVPPFWAGSVCPQYSIHKRPAGGEIALFVAKNAKFALCLPCGGDKPRGGVAGWNVQELLTCANEGRQDGTQG